MVLDEMARRHQTDFRPREDAEVARVSGSWQGWLAKPGTFMNLSGFAVQKLRSFYKIPVDDVLVITDDVNLPLGRLRARARGSEGGHNGLRSIIEQLGTNEFPRLRVGVGRGDTRRDLADHVLARFEADEAAEIGRSVLRAADAADIFGADGIEKVMNAFNRVESEGT
jgi:PTH1 family peptidyl-tRNA hydrolase